MILNSCIIGCHIHFNPLFDFSAENGRIILEKTNDTSCRILVKNIQIRDEGQWMFTVETAQGQNKTLKKFLHNVSVKVNGKKIHK